MCRVGYHIEALSAVFFFKKSKKFPSRNQKSRKTGLNIFSFQTKLDIIILFFVPHSIVFFLNVTEYCDHMRGDFKRSDRSELRKPQPGVLVQIKGISVSYW